MNKSALLLSLFFSLQSFAMNATVGGGSDGAVAPAKCIRGDGQQASKFYLDTVEVANAIKLDLAKFKGDIERGISAQVAAHIMTRVKSTSLYESSMCTYRISHSNTIGGAESMAGRLAQCDADSIETQLRIKAQGMINLAGSHKDSFLEAIAAGSREKFVSKVINGNCQ